MCKNIRTCTEQEKKKRKMCNFKKLKLSKETTWEQKLLKCDNEGKENEKEKEGKKAKKTNKGRKQIRQENAINIR